MRHERGVCVYLQVPPLQVQELWAADVMADEGVFVFPQAELLQPGTHLLSAPPLNYTSQEQQGPFSLQAPDMPQRTWANGVRGPKENKIKQNNNNHKGGKNQKQKEKTQKGVAAAAG